jgi:hypoxanthine-DNA glycosylase
VETATRRADPATRVPVSRGFEPLSAPSARVLILGSLPGQMSLAQQQYYAQPHNAFWRIMGCLFGAGPDVSYSTRSQRLMASGVAVWDVCASACRPGSLDASIIAGSVAPNDFAAFFERHPRIAMIAFNGATAASLYARLVERSLPDAVRGIAHRRLPSTSPAHASLTFDAKVAAWRQALCSASACRTSTPAARGRGASNCR